MFAITTTHCLVAIAAELALGAAMATGYRTLLEPNAPRHAAQAAPAAAPAPASAAAPSLRDLGVRALTAERYRDALRLFEQARRADPTNPDLAYLTGIAFEATNQVGAAIDAFRACRTGDYAAQARDHIALMIAKLQGELAAAAEQPTTATP